MGWLLRNVLGQSTRHHLYRILYRSPKSAHVHEELWYLTIYRFDMKTLLIIALSICSLFAKAQSFQPDLQFAGTGQVMMLQKGQASYGRALLQQNDGKLLVAGEAEYPHPFFSVSTAMLYRLNIDGSFDTTFADSGRFETALNTNLLLQTADMFAALALQPDNKIVAAGTFSNTLAVFRFHPNGTLDSTFGTNGHTEIVIGANSNSTRALTVLPTGSIVVAAADGSDFLLLRYNSLGGIDSAFGGTGIVRSDFFGSVDEIGGMLVQADGKILASGYTWNNSTGYDFAVCRYLSNGTLDASFGNSGKTTVDFGTIYDYGNKIHRRANGNYVLVGNSTLNDAKNKYAVAELLPNGSINNAFANSGTVIANTNTRDNFASASVLTASNEIIIVGTSYNFSTTSVAPLLMKVNALGAFDYSLNATGFYYFNQSGVSNAQFNDVMLQQDGKLTICGMSNLPGDYRMDVLRFGYLPPVSTVGFAEEVLKLQLKILPNPASDNITLVSNQTTQIELINSIGVRIRTIALSSQESAALDVSKLPAGCYVLRDVLSGQSHKLMVQR